VIVNGASGAVGSNAVQLARHFGAEVTGVTSTGNVALVRELGADHVVDYTRTPLAQLDDRYDVVLDTVGTLDPASGRRLLTPDGVLLLAVADLWQTVTSRGNVRSGSAPERPADWSLLLDLVAAGTLRVVVDRTVPLDDVAAAHARVDSGHKVGNVIVRP
jgi:NADPH:quinone reductase-like Zn-dependent oxidoreductase